MLQVWEEHATRAIVKARGIIRREQERMVRSGHDDHGRELRVDELDAIADLCNEALAHIDTHDLSGWQEDTPLP